jgi:putative membrane protein
MLRKAALLALIVAGSCSASATSASYPTSAWDKEWLKTSISGDRFEIMGGKLALKKSKSLAVWGLAQRLVQDHTKSLNESLALARRLGVKAPKDPTPSMQWEIMMVSQLNGQSFDYNYSKLELYDHSQDIEEAKSEASDGTNKLVRQLAEKELPTLRAHLSLSKRAYHASPAPNA